MIRAWPQLCSSFVTWCLQASFKSNPVSTRCNCDAHPLNPGHRGRLTLIGRYFSTHGASRSPPSAPLVILEAASAAVEEEALASLTWEPSEEELWEAAASPSSVIADEEAISTESVSFDVAAAIVLQMQALLNFAHSNFPSTMLHRLQPHPARKAGQCTLDAILNRMKAVFALAASALVLSYIGNARASQYPMIPPRFIANVTIVSHLLDPVSDGMQRPKAAPQFEFLVCILSLFAV